MKPSKSLVYCLEAKRTKTLFESEKKAENFIKFNSKDIAQQSGYAPVRSYSCTVCGGWHVTSIEDATGIVDKTADMLENLKKEKQLKEEAKAERALLRNNWKDRQAEVLAGIQQNVESIKKQIDRSGARIEIEQKIEQALAEIRNIHIYMEN